MSYATEGQAIRSHVSSNWTQTPVQFPNAAFDPVPGQPWARLAILPVAAERLCVGDPPTVRRHTGLAVFQVFVPPDTGDGAVRDLVDTATAMFRDPGIVGLKFREPEARNEGLDDFGWVGWTIETSFERDEVI